jgi:hypothetical protein
MTQNTYTQQSNYPNYTAKSLEKISMRENNLQIKKMIKILM